MSADEWDADDFVPTAPAVEATDKWKGEDEGDKIKNAWDVEEEKKVEETGDDASLKATQRKKKKPLAERIAEKEAARIAQEKAEKEITTKVLSKQVKQTEAERLKKIHEEADLKLAKEAFGMMTS